MTPHRNEHKMRTTARNFLPLITLLLGLAGACADVVDPTESESSATSPASGNPENTSDTPTDDSSDGVGTSAQEDGTSAEETGDTPVVCNPEDALEPNNIEDDAHKLPNITDEDAAGASVTSILAGSGDVDWFAYMGSDVAFAVVDPAGLLDADMELRLCLFVECTNGPTMPFTCLDSVYDESPELTLPGCCNTGGSTYVSIDLYCDAAGDESAYIFMRVDHGRDDICVPYEITYHF